MKNSLILVLLLAIAGLATLSWFQYREIGRLRAAALSANERALWEKRLTTAQKRTRELEKRLSSAESGDAAANRQSAANRTGPGRRGPGGMMSLMAKPEMARLMGIQQKAQINARYAALFKKLGLSADKVNQLKALLADKMSVASDVMSVASQQGIDPMENPEEFRQLMQSAQTEIEEKIKTMLGAAGYAQYQAYVQTESQRTIVSQLEQSLSYTSSPLSSTQSEQLLQILSESATTTSSTDSSGSENRPPAGEMGPPPDGDGSGGGGPRGPGSSYTITDSALAQAQSILTSAQYEALQELQQQQQAASQIRQQIFSSGGGGPPPPPGN